MQMQDMGSGRVWLEEGVDDDDYVDDTLAYGENPFYDDEDGEEEEEEEDGGGWWNGPPPASFSRLPRAQEEQEQEQQQRQPNVRTAPRVKISPVSAPMTALTARAATAATDSIPAASGKEREKQELMRQALAARSLLLRPPLSDVDL